MSKKNKRGLLDRKPTGILGKIAAAFGAKPAHEYDEAETEEQKIPEHVLRWAEQSEDDELGDEEEKTIVGFGDYEPDDEGDLKLKGIKRS